MATQRLRPAVRISISEVIARIREGIGLPSGVKIKVTTKDRGETVHGRTKIMLLEPTLENLIDRATNMRVAMFCERLARCIGAQVGARVWIEFAGREVDGRRALKTLI